MIPEFDDMESALAAQDALTAAQAQLDDAWARWGVIMLGGLFARLPLLQAVRFSMVDSGPMNANGPHMIRAGLANPKDPDEPLTFDAVRALSKLGKIWGQELLTDTSRADTTLSAWSMDGRFAPLMRAAALRVKNHGRSEWLQGSPKLDAASLCEFLGRPDIQAAFDRKAIGASAQPGASSVPAARI